MKKTIITSCLGMIITAGAFAQPIHDRAVIPVAVTLEQILRVKIISGGNMEFVFHTIDDYKNGMPSLAMAGTGYYTSTIGIAASSSWQLDLGTEEPTFVGTDDPSSIAFPIGNVGFVSTLVGNYTLLGGEIVTGLDYPNAGTAVADVLVQYTGQGTALLWGNGVAGSNDGGDINDILFTLDWQVGTPLLIVTSGLPSILLQSLPPDRYVSNVLLELSLM